MESRNNLLLPRENIEKQLRSCEGYRRNNPWWAGRSYRIALTCLSAMDARDAAEARVRELEAAASGFQTLHESDVARRAETINALKAFDAKNKELEAQCAAMRGALDEALKFVAVTPWTNKAPWTDDRLNGLFEAGQAALSGDAGRALLERVENLERLRRAVKNAIGQDGTDDWSDVIGILDVLEPKP